MATLLSKKKRNEVTKIEVHNAARAAYDFIQQSEYLFENEIISIKIKSTDKIAQPPLTLHVIHNQNALQIISGFEHPLFTLNKSILKNSIIIEHPSNLDDNDIEQLAWHFVKHTLFFSIRESSLGSMLDRIQESMPKPISKELFDMPKLSEKKLAEMTSKSRSCIATQRKKSREKKPNDNKPHQFSIFEEISKELKEDGTK
ncbi:hypothetical protein [Parashewanella tropica]|uniref:hypothetical protein n=1 Tax=Parashewanella tropica TaxID=2547970 RepID=UPI00105A218A|nr:hypothetical protein [Parashewanella tropica]